MIDQVSGAMELVLPESMTSQARITTKISIPAGCRPVLVHPRPEDGGKTWRRFKVVWEGPAGEKSDHDLIFLGKDATCDSQALLSDEAQAAIVPLVSMDLNDYGLKSEEFKQPEFTVYYGSPSGV